MKDSFTKESLITKELLKAAEESHEKLKELLGAGGAVKALLKLQIEAVDNNDIEKLKKLFIHEFSIHVKDEKDRTLLHHAAEQGRSGMVAFLVENGINVHSVDDDGMTPLHYASKCEYFLGKQYFSACEEIIKYLIKCGANVHARDAFGNTPLKSAVKTNIENVKILIENGARVSEGDKRDFTPLHRAAEVRNLEAVKYLIDHGADVNAKDILKQTPIWCPVKRGYVEIVRCLYENGADLNSKNDVRHTLYDAAVANNASEVVDYFNSIRERDALQSVIVEDGKTAKPGSLDF